jgi:hypothetical protein
MGYKEKGQLLSGAKRIYYCEYGKSGKPDHYNKNRGLPYRKQHQGRTKKTDCKFRIDIKRDRVGENVP